MGIPRKYIVLGVFAIIAFIAWRKFGSHIKSAISGLTA